MDEKEKLKKVIYRRLLIGFFVSMFIFTIISRVIDVYETPKVRTAFVSQGLVLNTVEGEGSVEAGEMREIPIIKGLKAGKIEAPAGTVVKEGDALFYYSMESLEKRVEELSKKIKKLELDIEGERIGAASYQGVTRTEVAAQALTMAERNLERQNGKKVQAESEYLENIEKLREYYEKRLELSEEELLNQSRSDYDQSRTNYETAKLERDAQLRELKRKIKDTEKKIEKLEKKEEPDEDQLDELRDLLESYEDDLETAEESWDLKLERAEDEMDDKGDIYDRAGHEADSARLALQEGYENSVVQEEKALEAAEDARLQAQWSTETARLELQNAVKEDNATALTGEQTRRLSELRIEAKLLDLEELKEEKDRLLDLTEHQGMVTAPCDGTVGVVELKEGKEADGTERVALSTGALLLRGTFDREEEESLRSGDELQVRMAGSDERKSAVVDQVDLVSSQDTGTFTAILPAGKAVLGEKAYFECKRGGEVYRQTIPVKALRQDVNGYYCLILRKQKSILGEEYHAVKVDLQLLVSGDTMAAVEGALTPEEPIITESDRVISVGDRVRQMIELPDGGN